MTYSLFPVHTKTGIEQRHIIYQYRGDNHWLSNFWPCNVVLPAESDALPAMSFDNVENAYMAWKTTDQSVRVKIQGMTPGDAKKFSHTADFPLRNPYTDDMRIKIMAELVEQKFSVMNPEMLGKLLATEDALLIEGNLHHDTFFGVDLEKGCGQNQLGRIQMKVRDKRRLELG